MLISAGVGEVIRRALQLRAAVLDVVPFKETNQLSHFALQTLIDPIRKIPVWSQPPLVVKHFDFTRNAAKHLGFMWCTFKLLLRLLPKLLLLLLIKVRVLLLSLLFPQ